ncbi:MAG: carboxypeptidase regulatory-like domain-containing protein, partial [Bryobacteraceae bacterium]
QVTLERVLGGGGAESRSALSDSRGRFSFTGLAAGAYLLSAQRAGYLRARYGQRRWDGAGSPVVLSAEAQFFAEIRLHRPGVITGQILDENGLGMAGQAVYAYRAGERPLKIAAAAVSDDRGVYRLTGLQPGNYYVRTGPRQLEDGRGLLPTFFGQTPSVAAARVVEAGLDRETSGVDIEPLPGRLARLAGRVTAGPATVALFSETGKREYQAGPDGGFVFDELAPGPYQLLAVTTHRPLRAAWERLMVGEGGAEVTLELAPLASLRVECEGKSGLRVEAERTMVFLLRQEPPEDNPLHVRGGQTISLLPGVYRVAVSAPLDYYVAYVRWPRTSVGPAVFEAPPGAVLELAVVLDKRPAAITGRVVDVDGKPVAGAPVFLLALDPEQQRLMEGTRSARSDHRGEYRFHGLAPGRYRLLSSFEIERPSESDWAVAETSTVSVEEGQTARLDLKLAGGL